MIKYLVLIVAAALLYSCNPTAYISQSFNPSNMKGIGYFEPQAYISVVQKGNRALPNDSLSGVAQYLLDSIIGHSRTFKTVRRMESPDFEVQKKIHVELNTTFSKVMRNKTIEGMALPPTVRSEMQTNNQRFALATATSGFGRRKGNYGGQVAKGVGIGILTLGMFVPVPIKSSTTLYALIFDSQKNAVVYFCRTIPVEQSPTDAHVLRSQFARLFTHKKYLKR